MLQRRDRFVEMILLLQQHAELIVCLRGTGVVLHRLAQQGFGLDKLAASAQQGRPDSAAARYDGSSTLD